MATRSIRPKEKIAWNKVEQIMIISEILNINKSLAQYYASKWMYAGYDTNMEKLDFIFQSVTVHDFNPEK